MEGYKIIPGFDNYGCTKDGKILSLSMRAHNYHIKRIKQLSAAKSPDGYMKVALCKNGKGHTFLVHTLVAMSWIGPKENGMQINHKDGNKTNNSIDNLEYVTHAENIRHSWEIGLRDDFSKKLREKVSGEKHYSSKISDEQFLQLLNDHKMGMRNKDIAKKYGLHQSTVSHYTGKRPRKII